MAGYNLEYAVAVAGVTPLAVRADPPTIDIEGVASARLGALA